MQPITVLNRSFIYLSFNCLVLLLKNIVWNIPKEHAKCYVFPQGAFTHADVFEDIPPLCERTNALILEVFSSPDVVITKFVLNIYHGKLQVWYILNSSTCLM